MINHISKSQFTSKLNHAITKHQRLSYEIYSFIQILQNYFSLKPLIIDSIQWHVKILKSDYRQLTNSCSYENICLAVMLHVCRNSGMTPYERIDISGFIDNLYRPEFRHREIVQIYSILQTLGDLFKDPDPRVSQIDEANPPIWKA